ncbi:MAG: glycosyltransferase family 39 protein [Myxococcales bacterium]|nr:glycosyltransferase family 39 protein [Myxococcales bacterium]
MAEPFPKLQSQAPLARALCYALGAAGLCNFGLTAATRALHPWPLEWMEGASLHHALRLLHGQPLYAAPSADFIAYLYPPLGYLPMALGVMLLGETPMAARLPSLLLTLLTLIAIARLAARSGGGRAGGVAAAGVFAMGFGYGGAFLDLARIDACFLALVSWAAERLERQRLGAALLLLGLAALTKQHGLMFWCAVAVAALWQRGREALVPVLRSGLFLLASLAWLSLSSDGWFLRYGFELPAGHDIIWELLASFFFVDLALYLPLLFVGGCLWLWPRLYSLRPEPLAALVLAALVAGALGRAHAGGNDNVRLPALAALCWVGLTPVLARLLSPSARRATRIGLGMALTLQFLMLWQAPSHHAPQPRDSRAYHGLKRALKRCAQGGSAVALDHALLTGSPFMHTMALWDLQKGHSADLAELGGKALAAGLGADDAPKAIAVGVEVAGLAALLEAHYSPCARVPAPRPATGFAPGSPGGHQLIYRRLE